MTFNTENIMALYTAIIEEIPLEVDDAMKEALYSRLRSFGSDISGLTLELFTGYLVGDFELLSYITVQLIELYRNKEGNILLPEREIGLYTGLARRYIENIALFDRRTKDDI